MFAAGGVVTLPWPNKALHPNGRPHFMARARETKKHREWARLATLAEKIRIPADGPILVTATFRPKTRNAIDGDGALSSCKAYFDGIADALKCDDSRFRHQAPVIGSPIKGGLVQVRLEVAE